MKWDHSLPYSGMDCVNPEYHMLTERQPLPTQRKAIRRVNRLQNRN